LLNTTGPVIKQNVSHPWPRTIVCPPQVWMRSTYLKGVIVRRHIRWSRTASIQEGGRRENNTKNRSGHNFFHQPGGAEGVQPKFFSTFLKNGRFCRLTFGKFGEKAKSRKKSQMKYFKPNNFKKAKEKPNFEKSQMKFCKPSAFKKSQIGVNLACKKAKWQPWHCLVCMQAPRPCLHLTSMHVVAC